MRVPIEKKVPEELRPGGVVKTRVLRQAGFTDAQIRQLVADGVLTRLRPGWLAMRWARAEVVEAVRGGGVLGCASALAFRGAWKFHGDKVHTYRSRHGRRGEHDGCPGPRSRIASDVAVLRIPEAFMQAVFCLPPLDFLVVAESAIHRRLITEEELREVLRGYGPGVDRLLSHLDRAESGTESYVRLRLRAKNIKVQPQVEIKGVGRVDFLIGTSLVLEVDSREHHEDPEAYERDRIRDQKLVALGYRVVRVTYDQVMYGWDQIEARLLEIIRAGLHQRRLVPQA